MDEFIAEGNRKPQTGARVNEELLLSSYLYPGVECDDKTDSIRPSTLGPLNNPGQAD